MNLHSNLSAFSLLFGSALLSTLEPVFAVNSTDFDGATPAEMGSLANLAGLSGGYSSCGILQAYDPPTRECQDLGSETELLEQIIWPFEFNFAQGYETSVSTSDLLLGDGYTIHMKFRLESADVGDYVSIVRFTNDEATNSGLYAAYNNETNTAGLFMFLEDVDANNCDAGTSWELFSNKEFYLMDRNDDGGFVELVIVRNNTDNVMTFYIDDGIEDNHVDTFEQDTIGDFSFESGFQNFFDDNSIGCSPAEDAVGEIEFIDIYGVALTNKDMICEHAKSPEPC